MGLFEKPLDMVRSGVQKKVQESKLPTRETLGYDSTVGVYGGKLVTDDEGAMIFDMSGFVSWVGLSGTAAALRPLTAVHNKARLNFDKNVTESLRGLISAECDAFAGRRNSSEQ